MSGPLLDRLDLRIELRRVPPSELVSMQAPEPTAVVTPRIAAARSAARERNGGRLNAELSGSDVTEAAALGPAARRALADIAEARAWSARGVHRVLRIARTIADLGNASNVDPATIHAAAGLRDPQERALAA